MSSTDGGMWQLETHLGRLLVAGVGVSAALLISGLAIWMLLPAPHVSDLLLKTGLYVLMATPILRVVVSVVEYIRMRDWFFAGTTLAVLAVLAGTVMFALRAR